MSALKVLRNIFQFANILNQAGSDVVKEWDLESVHNSLNWADYLQEVYCQVRNQPCEKDLAHQLHQITLLLEPVSCLSLSLDTLCQAKPLLVEVLLSNPSMPSELKSILTTKLQANEVDSLVFTKVKESFRETESSFRISENLLKILRPVKCSHLPDRHVIKLKSMAKSLALQLTLACSKACGEKQARFKSYCHQICERLTADENSWNILVAIVCMSLTAYDDLTQHTQATLTGYINEWMKSKLMEGDIVGQSPLLKTLPELLKEASRVNQQFFYLYLEALTQWADTFLPSVTVDTDSPVSWRSPDGFTLQDLVSHFEALFASCEELVELEARTRRQKVLNCITSKMESLDLTVWNDLAYTLMNRLKNR